MKKIRKTLQQIPDETKYPHGEEKDRTLKFGTKNSKQNCPYKKKLQYHTDKSSKVKTTAKTTKKNIHIHNTETSIQEPSESAIRHAKEELQKDPTISKSEIEQALKIFRKIAINPLLTVYRPTCFKKLKINIKEKTMKTREQHNISRPKTITNKLKDVTTQQSNNGSAKNNFTTPYIPTKQQFPIPHGTTNL
jgi:hypothetical protein